MWIRWALTALLVIATSAVGRAQTAPDPGRLALAQQLTDEIGRETVSGHWQLAAIEPDLKLAVALGWNDAPAGQRPARPTMDLAQLRASLEAGVAATAPKLRQAMADAYARALDANTLRAALVCYGAPGEQATIRRRSVMTEQLIAHQSSDAIDLSLTDAERARRTKADAALRAQINALTPTEAAFDATPSGKAFLASAGPVGRAMSRASPPIWAEAVDDAQRGYCAKRPCDAATRGAFAGLRKYFDGPAGGGAP